MMKRCIFSVFLALALVCPAISAEAYAAELPEGLREFLQDWLEQNRPNESTDFPWGRDDFWEIEIPESQTYSGSCGTYAQWSFDPETAVLKISGTGAMDDWRVPWSSFSRRVTSVVIESGVTHIGEWAFCACENLTQATIPASVTSIATMPTGRVRHASQACFSRTHA